MQHPTRLLMFFIGLLFLFLDKSSCEAQSFPSELDRFKAMIDKDSITLNELIHPDLVYVHSNGLVENKVQHLHNILTSYIEYKNIANEEFRMRKYDKWTLINGVISVSGAVDKKPFDIRLRYSAAYIKENKKWRLINWQSTKL